MRTRIATLVVVVLGAHGGAAAQDDWASRATAEVEARSTRDVAYLRGCRSHLDASASPSVTLRFTVRPDGRLSGLRVVPVAGESAQLRSCVHAVARRWRLPAHPGPRPRTLEHVLALPGPGGPTSMILSLGTYGGPRPHVSRLQNNRPVPVVRLGRPTVGPSYSPELIRRVVHRHRNEIRFCYEQQLAVAPTLAGRVEIAFTIDEQGKAVDVSIALSTLGSPPVESCLQYAVRRWSFPVPTAGRLIVRYPFVFEATPAAP